MTQAPKSLRRRQPGKPAARGQPGKPAARGRGAKSPQAGQPEQKRISRALQLLKKHYPKARCALDFKNPLELLIAAQLSAQCTDKRVNIVTKSLFKSYKTARDYARAPLKKLEAAVHSTGFFRNKARNIKKACQELERHYKGRPPADFEKLTGLAGVGRKTAHVVMGNGFGLPSGIVVDTHVKRLSNRLGFAQTANVLHIERGLEKLIPKKDWIMLSHYLIEHGRQICLARRPRCGICFLSELCPKRGVRFDGRPGGRSRASAK